MLSRARTEPIISAGYTMRLDQQPSGALHRNCLHVEQSLCQL